MDENGKRRYGKAHVRARLDMLSETKQAQQAQQIEGEIAELEDPGQAIVPITPGRPLEVGPDKMTALERKAQGVFSSIRRSIRAGSTPKRTRALVDVLYAEAIEHHNMRAIEILIEQVDGKVPQTVEQSGRTNLHVTIERLG
jgi:hypothetical protein